MRSVFNKSPYNYSRISVGALLMDIITAFPRAHSPGSRTQISNLNKQNHHHVFREENP